MGCDSSASLAPGFRFHPTDEELVRYYLRRKVSGKSVRFDPISVVEIYKSEPWDLPDKSKLKSRDLEWYFFSPLDKKYGNSSRTNRATENGYWKTTGKDRPVRHNSRIVGMKKTLVYHRGRAPRGDRSNWVMHEYRLTDEDLERAGIAQDGFVLCRIFQKSGAGPKNGEQYGAPFVEEDWENDEEVTIVPGEEIEANEGLVDDNVQFEMDDIVQDLNEELLCEDAQLSPNVLPEGIRNHVEQPNGLNENDLKPVTFVGDNEELQYNSLEQCGMDVKSVKDDYFAESSDAFKHEDVDYLLDESYSNVLDNFALSEELFLETNDLSNPVETDIAGLDVLEEYLTFFDADDNLHLSFDPSEILDSQGPIDNQTISEKEPKKATENEFVAVKQMPYVASSNDASTSNQKPETIETDSKSQFLKRASYLLGNIPAPDAFASEFPSKDMMIRLNSAAAQTTSSVHLTTGMIQMRNVTLNSDVMNGKNVDVNLILSFGQQGGGYSALPQKNVVMGSRGFLLFFLVFWALILLVSFKVGRCVYAHAH